VHINHIVTSSLCDVADVPADVDRNGSVNVADATLFTGWYASQDARADLDESGIIDVADFALFSASYACGCQP
jgi:hypothetical protein